MWLRPEGEVLYEAFMREQLSEGGIFQSALAEGMITSPMQELQIRSRETSWSKQVLRSDVMNMVHFEANDVTGALCM
jgi:hypothetical protein